MTECSLRTARDKLRPVADLVELAARARQAGKRVVLCHGVFDLLHMGHVRHFEAARREGDVLMVTLTADAFVNKGPGRPIFTDILRAEMVAAVEYVDWVAINQSPSAEVILRAVKPDVYVKGSDYADPEEDITGKISEERQAVERHGGRIVFTKGITFSSSNLINRYLDVYDPPLRDYLETLRGQKALDGILGLVERVRDMKVLLIGDAIVDEYRYVQPLERARKDPIIASRLLSREIYAGGVLATANHMADFVAEVEVVTVLGGRDPHEELIRRSLHPNVKLTVITRPGAPTTLKARYLEQAHMRKMFEVCDFDDSPYSPELQAEVDLVIAARLGTADVVVVNDFGHGLIRPSTINLLQSGARFLAVNAQTNSANYGYNLVSRYRRADYICIDGLEARLAAGDRFSDLATVVVEGLTGIIDCSRFVVTAGILGAIAYEVGGPVHRVPVLTKTVVDTVGAGDAFFALSAPLVAVGGSIDQVALVGNAAGAIKVGIVGHRRAVAKAPLMKFITALLK